MDLSSLQETGRNLVQAAFAIDSIWSVVLRGAIWLGIALVIIVGSDAANPDKSLKSMKANLGFFLLFVLVTGGLVYFLFGFNISATAAGSAAGPS
jgi:hypothetical protein